MLFKISLCVGFRDRYKEAREAKEAKEARYGKEAREVKVAYKVAYPYKAVENGDGDSSEGNIEALVANKSNSQVTI